MFLLLADLIAVVHALLVLGIAFGTLAAVTGRLRRFRRAQAAYYLALLCVVTSQLFEGECILTVMEKALRKLHSPGSGYHTSFLRHYLPWISLSMVDSLGPAVTAIAVLSYPVWRIHDYRTRSAGPVAPPGHGKRSSQDTLR